MSQADALQAEASTKLKGLLAAAATASPAPVQAATTPAMVDLKQAITPSEASSNKRLRENSDEGGTKKQNSVQLPEPSGLVIKKEAVIKRKLS